MQPDRWFQVVLADFRSLLVLVSMYCGNTFSMLKYLKYFGETHRGCFQYLCLNKFLCLETYFMNIFYRGFLSPVLETHNCIALG